MWQLSAAASRVIARLQNASLVSAYGRWYEYWLQCRTVRRVTIRMKNMRMSQSFVSWAEAVDAAISTREQSSATQSLALLREEVDAQILPTQPTSERSPKRRTSCTAVRGRRGNLHPRQQGKHTPSAPPPGKGR